MANKKYVKLFEEFQDEIERGTSMDDNSISKIKIEFNPFKKKFGARVNMPGEVSYNRTVIGISMMLGYPTYAESIDMEVPSGFRAGAKSILFCPSGNEVETYIIATSSSLNRLMTTYDSKTYFTFLSEIEPFKENSYEGYAEADMYFEFPPFNDIIVTKPKHYTDYSIWYPAHVNFNSTILKYGVCVEVFYNGRNKPESVKVYGPIEAVQGYLTACGYESDYVEL